jgi:hypothetical protein
LSIFTVSPYRHAMAVAAVPSHALGGSLRFDRVPARSFVLFGSVLRMAVAACFWRTSKRGKKR